MKQLPLRLRLTLWYCAIFTAAAVLLSVSSWWMLRVSLASAEYHTLQEHADDVQVLLAELGPGAGRAMTQQKFEEVYRGKDDGKYLQVLDQDGKWIYRSRRMVEQGLQLATPERLTPEGALLEFHQGARYVLALTYAIHANGRAYSVETGIALNKSITLLTTFGERLLLLTPAVLLMAAVGGHFMSRKALRPVAALAAEARRINDRNLDIRLPVVANGDEIAHLTETLNQMLERVELGIRSTREFVANASHELRTPLALIRTEVEVALSKPRSAEQYRETCEQVQMDSARVTGLIDGLLMLARADAGSEPLRFLPLDANQLAVQVGAKWKTAMHHALLDFSVVQASTQASISGDASSLERLLAILLDNALRYTPPGGSVQMEVACEQNRVMFTVRDSGIGIAPEHQSRIFDRFYRANRTHGGNSCGAGLGLALAKWIADKHDVSLMLESGAGRGSSFRFAFPQIGVIGSLADGSNLP